MEFVLNVLKETVLYVLGTLVHNLPALVLGVLVAAAIKVYLDPDVMKNWLMRRSSISIPATVVFGAFTPFCACGTMAVVLSMMATALPWGPIMAFLTSSPLMSPEEFVLISGIISPGFAIALAVSSVVIGIGSGYVTHLLEKNTNFLKDQLRFAGNDVPKSSSCCSAGSAEVEIAAVSCCISETDGCGCSGEGTRNTANGCNCGDGTLALEPSVNIKSVVSLMRKYKIDKMFNTILDVGVKKILPLFSLFAGIGHLINEFIPSTWITAVFGTHNLFAVPLTALIGLPLYVNGDSSIPLIQSLMKSGVSSGAMLAFMITGPGTSAGVLAGISTIMKKKAIILYVAFLLVGAILLGYAYDLLKL